MTPLRQRMLEDMSIRNFTQNTQLAYLQQVSSFAKHFDRSPEELGPEEVRLYQHHLVSQRHLSASSVGTASAALRFLYRVTLRRDWKADDIAKVVRKIFDEFSAGSSLQRIVHRLNTAGVVSPRGKSWSVSALRGSASKGAGVLNNELYIGQRIWNRSQWLKDPDTRKRVRVDRPRDDWSVKDRQDLRIVDDTTWHAVKRSIIVGVDLNLTHWGCGRFLGLPGR